MALSENLSMILDKIILKVRTNKKRNIFNPYSIRRSFTVKRIVLNWTTLHSLFFYFSNYSRWNTQLFYYIFYGIVFDIGCILCRKS